MTRTQYYTATSADGYIADEHNGLDWLFAVDRGGADRFGPFFAEVGAMCMGATTYEWVLEHEAHNWRKNYGDTPCWVFTHRELPLVSGANLRFVAGDVTPVHDEMTAAAAGKNIWVVGGGELAGQFADAGRLDELILGVTPVFLGSGAPLLPRRLLSDRVKLTGVERLGQMVSLTYTLGG